MEKFLAYGLLVGILSISPAIVCMGQCSRAKREPAVGIFFGLILSWFGVLLLALTLPSPDGKRSKLAKLADKRRNNASGTPGGSGPVLPTISELTPLQQPAPQPQTLPAAASYLKPSSQILPKLSSASYKALNLPLRPSSNISPKVSSASYRALNLPLRPPTTTVPKLNSGSYRALNLPVRNDASSGSHRALNHLPLRTGNSSASYRALNIPLRPSGMSSATYRTINLPLRNRMNSVLPKPTSNTTIFVTLIALCIFGLGLFFIGGSKSSTKPVAMVTPAEVESEASRLTVMPVRTASGGTHSPSVKSTRDDLDYADFLRRSKAQHDAESTDARSPFQTRPDSNREASARSTAANESLAIANNDPRSSELRARAEREAQVDAELQRNRTLSPTSPEVASSVAASTAVAGIDGAVGVTTAAFSSTPDADARVAEIRARAALEAQAELDAGEQTPGDMKKKAKPAAAPRVTVNNGETPGFIEATSNSNTGSVSRFAQGKGDLEVKRQVREQQAAAEKASADLVKEGTLAILKTRLATAELNRSNLIQNPPEAIQKGAQTGTTPKDDNGDIAQWTSLVKRADGEIESIKREMRNVESK